MAVGPAGGPAGSPARRGPRWERSVLAELTGPWPRCRARYLFLFDKVVIVCKRRGYSYELKEVIELLCHKMTDDPMNNKDIKKVGPASRGEGGAAAGGAGRGSRPGGAGGGVGDGALQRPGPPPLAVTAHKATSLLCARRYFPGLSPLTLCRDWAR